MCFCDFPAEKDFKEKFEGAEGNRFKEKWLKNDMFPLLAGTSVQIVGLSPREVPILYNKWKRCQWCLYCSIRHHRMANIQIWKLNPEFPFCCLHFLPTSTFVGLTWSHIFLRQKNGRMASARGLQLSCTKLSDGRAERPDYFNVQITKSLSVYCNAWNSQRSIGG